VTQGGREVGGTAEAVCGSVNLSEAPLDCWHQQFGAQELSEVMELKALGEGRARLRRVVSDILLKEVNAKDGEPDATPLRSARRGRGGSAFPALGVPRPWVGPLVVCVPSTAANGAAVADGIGWTRWRAFPTLLVRPA